MWFDAQAALAEIAGQPPATSATSATQAPETRPMSQLSQVSQHPPPQKPENAPSASDPETYLAFLHREGPQTYGAAATALGWGATRTWQAEARLRAAGLVRYGEHGKAYPMATGTDKKKSLQ